MKGKQKARAHPVPKSSGFKKLVRGVARRNRKTVAKQVLADSRTRCHLFSYLKRYIQKDMSFLCSKKNKSILRQKTPERFCSFTWENLASEIEIKAPTLYAILKACVDVKRRQKKANKPTKRHKCHTSSNTAILGVCAGVLLRHRNHHMNLLQRIIAMILHAGHSSKQVIKLSLSLFSIII